MQPVSQKKKKGKPCSQIEALREEDRRPSHHRTLYVEKELEIQRQQYDCVHILQDGWKQDIQY
jgi:hypothetical protein